MRTRKLYLDICDYTKTPVCNLYDNQSDISGQATNVHITTERNGWKELSFDIPSTYVSCDGLTENHRLKYLIAEYRIRAVDDNGTDWFIISEPKITHEAWSKNVSVIAGHVSQLLKNKSLDLEFSEDEGNNVGTAEQLLETILEGSGWSVGYVYPFKEDNGNIKVRSLNGQAGTGALSFIQQLCDVFEAKPVYDGDKMQVALYEMNPFAKYDTDQIVKNIGDVNVFELHYDRAIHNVEKTTNTDSMATRLYAYGSSGDLNGACTLQNAEHKEYYFMPDELGEEYSFESDGKYFFKANLDQDNILIWSDLDITSKTYIWNDTKKVAYKVTKKPEGSYKPLIHTDTQTVLNQFPYLLGLKYYDDVGLMTETQFQDVALFQRVMPELYRESQKVAAAYADSEYQLSIVGESNTGFLKLNIKEYGLDDGNTRVVIDTDTYDNGVVYRSDYDVAERRYFQWHVAKSLKPNGDPVSGTPSVLYVIHDTTPITWDKVYLKKIYDQDGNLVVDSLNEPGSFKYGNGYPSAVTVWGTLRRDPSDRVYLFCTNSMSGNLGAKQLEDEAVIENLASTTKDGSESHPTYFALNDQPNPNTDFIGYGWLYKYDYDPANVGELYFCWKSKGDESWHKVYTEYTEPVVVNGDYFYHLKYKTLWHGESGQWVKYESAAEQRVANMFTKVFYYCRRRDMLYKGLYEYYTYSTEELPVANYAIGNDFAFYWTFTTDKTAQGEIELDTVNGRVLWDDEGEDHFVTSSVVPLETVFFPSENEFESTSFSQGTIDMTTGVEEDSTNRYRSGTIKVWEDTVYEYNVPSSSAVMFYDVNLKYISGLAIGSTGTFTTRPQTKYIRIVSPSIPSGYLRVQGYDTRFYINEKPYIILDSIGRDGELLGINTLTKKFADLADATYEEYLPALKSLQEEIRDRDANLSELLGDMLKDGRWQDSNYVSGDEKRLYDDATYMHKQVSYPEITYSFTYLSMYGTHNEHYYEEHDFEWPEIEITDAAHLVDPEINTNCWAYVEKIDRWYDQEWKTTVDVDTKLTLATNHSFTDVVARIAEVAKETKLKRSQYEQAISGPVESSRLEGAIALNQNILNGGASNYYTDNDGNMIFESADGLSAMILGGRGLGVANSKNSSGDWEFRSAITGYGLTADEIVTGYLNAERIEAHSITADRLMANVGQELDIGSNKALTLFATVNGSRPAGSLLTTDAKIEIRAGYEESGSIIPAKIDIASGGELDLTGGDVNITSGSTLSLTSAAEFYLRAKGADSLDSTADGLYMGTDGINFGGGKFKVAFSGDTSTVNMTAGYIALGTPGNEATEFILDNNTGIININAANEINVTAGNTLTLITESSNNEIGQVLIGDHTAPFIIGADTITYDEEDPYDRAYIYNGRDNVRDNTHDGVYLGTDGINVGMVEGYHVIATADGNVDISGTVYASAGEIGSWTIGSTLHSGSGSNYIALGANGDYRIWAGAEQPEVIQDNTLVKAPFSVKKDGTVYSVKGIIGGWTLSSASLTGNKTGIAITTNDSDIAFWAGSNTSTQGNFRVTQDGKLYATGAEISGNSTFAGSLSAATGSFAGSLSAATGTFEGTVTADGVIACNVSASNIYGGTLILGGNDNVNGVLSIRNASNNQIGSWDKTGITATAGEIGGWTIGTNSLHSGSGSTYVELNSDPSNDYAIWSGAASAANASFKVKRSGEVYLTKLIIQKESNDGSSSSYTTEELNLTSNDNRLRGGTILGWSSSKGEMYTTVGTVNFNSAASLRGYWDGNIFKVYNINISKTTTLVASEPVLIGSHPEDNGVNIQAYSGTGPAWITDTARIATLEYSVDSASEYSRSTNIKLMFDGSTEVMRQSLYAYWDVAHNSGHTAGSANRLSLGTKEEGTYIWNITVTANDGGTTSKMLNLGNVYTDARDGYTEGTFALATVTLQGTQTPVYIKSTSGTAYYKAGTAFDYYEAGTVSKTDIGDPLVVTPISTSTAVRLGNATTYYKRKSTTDRLIGTQANYDYYGPLYPKNSSQAIGNGYWYLNQEMYYKGDEVYVVDGSVTAREVLSSGGTIYYQKGSDVNGWKGNGGSFTVQGTKKSVTPITGNALKLTASTRYNAGSTVTDTYYTKS